MDVDLNSVNLLTQASIAYDYLHANSTTHEHLFGAIAELVDNSRDANSTRLDIDVNDEMLYFVDDGCGMSKNEVANVVNFGHSVKRMDDQMIGQYGNGLKSGTMRIAKDFMLFTKKDGLLTALLLSRTFHEKNRLKKVFVPIPCFTPDRFPHFNSKEDEDRHALEMKIIYEYSPFKDFHTFFQQFSYILTESGTVVICFNLRRIENGQLEMDLDANLEDIRVKEYEHELTNEVSSLRDYLAVLYSNPRMRIYLRGKKVNTCRLLSNLYKPRMYQYRAKNLKAYAAKEHEQCMQRIVDLKEHLKICRSNLGEFTRMHANYMCDSNLRLEYRLNKRAEEQALILLKAAEQKAKDTLKAKSNPRPISFYFGLNILHRDQYGCLIYNNGRLITYYAKTACQNDKIDMKYLGVCGIVDVPYSVLEPTHNKQSFANKRDYLSLMKAFNEHMIQYWMDAGIEKSPGISNFWKEYGYTTMNWDEKPNLEDSNVVYKRNAAVGMCVQCDLCLKWRIIEYQRRYLSQEFPECWDCTMNPNTSARDCQKPEVLPKVPEGKLTLAAKFSNTKRGLILDEEEDDAVPVKLPPTRGRREVTPPQTFSKSAPVRLSRKVPICNFRDSDDDEPKASSPPPTPPPKKTRTRTPVKKEPSPPPPPKKTRNRTPVRKEPSPPPPMKTRSRTPAKKEMSPAPPPRKMMTRSKRNAGVLIEEAPSLRKGTASRPCVQPELDGLVSPDQKEVAQNGIENTIKSSTQEDLDTATRIIRRLLQINAPEGFSKMDALTMSQKDLLRFNLDDFEKRIKENRRKELDNVTTALRSMPHEMFDDVTAENCLEKLSNYADDLRNANHGY
uniref:CW-type domain-containing protein n=1 Tax=Steinernema glaseri TaxID=37863 RepID=A0A1I7ZL87_9BILA